MNISYTGHNPCSSCGLCVIVCSNKAINFCRNEEGFYEPTVMVEKCTDCGICIKVCYKYLKEKVPFENAFKEKIIYGAWSKNIETVKTSSSGGIGYELTSHFFEKGYKICGCVFDAPNDSCKHIIAETDTDLEAIKTSKYLQSNTIEAFSQFKKDVNYLIVGTPCQIYGLRNYIHLKKWEDNFILIDFFCYGTPSFNLWKKYKSYLSKKNEISNNLKNVNFRKKNFESKWHQNAISIQDCSGRKFVQNFAYSESLFFKFFLNGSCLNEACYQCKMRLDHCASDIRIADFWGKKYATNEWGVSLVITNTNKGKQSFDEIITKLEMEICNFHDLQNSQGCRFVTPNKKRRIVLNELKSEINLDEIYRKHFAFKDFCRKTIIGRIFSIIKSKCLQKLRSLLIGNLSFL